MNTSNQLADRKILCAAIIFCMRVEDVSSRQVGKAIGLRPDALSRKLGGRRSFTAEELHRLEGVLNISPGALSIATARRLATLVGKNIEGNSAVCDGGLS